MLKNATALWLKRIGLAAVAAIGIGVTSLSPSPASAQYYPYYYAPPAQPHYYPKYRTDYRRCAPGWHYVRGYWDRWGRWVPSRCRRNR